MTLLCVLLCLQAFRQVRSEDLLPPQDVHVKDGLLRWTPSTQHRHLTYTVQYRSFDNKWKDVSSCVQTTLTSCNVSSTAAEAENGCVMLRLRAERDGVTSRWTEACSRQGDSCSPVLDLAARPGSLTVKLSRNHSMAQEHGDHAKHRVYFGQEGRPLRIYKDAATSVSIPELEEGQSYCVKVQYIYYGQPVGAPSCPRCVVIPESSVKSHAGIVAPVAVAVIMLPLVGVAYALIFKCGKIKKWLRPPYTIPEYVFEPIPESRSPLSMSSPDEERYDEISVVIQQDSAHRP